MNVFPRLIARLVLLALFHGALTVATAQSAGDSMGAVRRQKGMPSAMRDTGTHQIWTYADGSQVVFSDGRVVSTDDAEIVVQDAEAAAEWKQAADRTGGGVAIHPSPEARTPPSSRDRPAPRTSPSSTSSSSATDSGTRLGELFRAWPFVVLAGLCVVSFACHTVIIVRAFKESMFWGLGCLFIPVVGLFFVMQHWYDTRVPFLLNFGCGVAMIPVLVLAPTS